MTPTELAAALERIDASDPAMLRTAHNTITSAAIALRELDAVRLAADALPVEHAHAEQCCPRCRLTDALRGVGGGK